MEFIKKNKKELIIAAVLLVLAIVSEFVLGKIFSDPNTYTWCYTTLDQKKNEVMALTATIAGSSAVLSLVGGDAASGISAQLANLSTYLLIILTAVYLEKYTLTVIGAIVFRIIIPVILVFYIISLFYKNNVGLRSVANKLLVFGIVLFLLVPSSVYISNMIEKTYEATIASKEDKTDSIQEQINQIGALEEEVEKVEQEPVKETKPVETTNVETSEEDKGIFESIGSFFTGAAETVVDKGQDLIDKGQELVEKGKEAVGNLANALKNILNDLKDQIAIWTEKIAIMIVTSCIIPIITFVFFLWITKLIFNYQGKTPSLIDIKNKTMNYVENITHNNSQQETKQIETKDDPNKQ